MTCACKFSSMASDKIVTSSGKGLCYEWFLNPQELDKSATSELDSSTFCPCLYLAKEAFHHKCMHGARYTRSLLSESTRPALLNLSHTERFGPVDTSTARLSHTQTLYIKVSLNILHGNTSSDVKGSVYFW